MTARTVDAHVTITIVVRRPLEVEEVTFADTGELTVRRAGANGAPGPPLRATIEASGAITVVEGPDPRAQPVPPVSTERHTNPFGVTIERACYAHGVCAERTFDDDGRLAVAAVFGPWGSQTVTVHPDGSRDLAWEIGPSRGRRHWDAAGSPTTVELSRPDGTTSRGSGST